jgi:streptomycin 3"-adenylyltransferase
LGPFKILDIIINKFKRILENNLVGVYLHGSLAMGCYTDSSDIDFLVVVRQPINDKIKKELISSIVYIYNLPDKGIEMSIILEKYAKEFVYPTPFELHYSDLHRDKYLANEDYICGGDVDQDLAAHMTVIKHRGICLYGRDIDDVFNNVPREAYINSILDDVRNAKDQILDNPIYIILNLCRVLYFVKEGIISSKLEGGIWAKNILPQKYTCLIEDALNVYRDKLYKMRYRKHLYVDFSDYILNQIDINLRKKAENL